MNILEFTRSTHVRNKIVVGNYHVVQLVVNFGTSTMLYVLVVARVDNLTVLSVSDCFQLSTPTRDRARPRPGLINDHEASRA